MVSLTLNIIHGPLTNRRQVFWEVQHPQWDAVVESRFVLVHFGCPFRVSGAQEPHTDYTNSSLPTKNPTNQVADLLFNLDGHASAAQTRMRARARGS